MIFRYICPNSIIAGRLPAEKALSGEVPQNGYMKQYEENHSCNIFGYDCYKNP
jgi:hypothetical protein